jgi:septal ring factor EnvC (AmiA/AmiB activator)
MTFVLAAGALAAPPSGVAADEAATDAEIEALREEITASRERVVAHEREERDLLQLLEAIDRGVEALRQEVRRSERRAEEAQRDWAEVEERLTEVRRDLARTRRAMARRAVALYKTGQIGPLRVLFSSVDLQQMLWKLSTLGRLLEYDAALVARYSDEQARLLKIEDEAARALAARDAARARLAARSAVFEQERAARRALLERVRADRSQERALLVELERAARALEETLAGLGGADLEAAALDGSGFETRKGRLDRPVPGPVRSRFGRVVDADYQTETFRNGIEIEAGPGESVRAVAPGQVRFTGWFRGYGKIVIVDHGGGYFTVSGHLADIYVEVGDVVDAGDTLGSVGDTGSLRGPGLYFEVRSGSQPLDPAQWLATG